MRTEAVEDGLLAFWRELKCDSLSVDPAAHGRPIQVFLLVEDQPGAGVRPVGAALLRTEAVEYCLLAFGSELEYDATALSVVLAALVVGPAAVGRPVKIPLLVEGQPDKETIPISAVALRTEAVKHTFGLRLSCTQ